MLGTAHHSGLYELSIRAGLAHRGHPAGLTRPFWPQNKHKVSKCEIGLTRKSVVVPRVAGQYSFQHLLLCLWNRHLNKIITVHEVTYFLINFSSNFIYIVLYFHIHNKNRPVWVWQPAGPPKCRNPPQWSRQHACETWGTELSLPPRPGPGRDEPLSTLSTVRRGEFGLGVGTPLTRHAPNGPLNKRKVLEREIVHVITGSGGSHTTCLGTPLGVPWQPFCDVTTTRHTQLLWTDCLLGNLCLIRPYSKTQPVRYWNYVDVYVVFVVFKVKHFSRVMKGVTIYNQTVNLVIASGWDVAMQDASGGKRKVI